jgi:hypothetical protein
MRGTGRANSRARTAARPRGDAEAISVAGCREQQVTKLLLCGEGQVQDLPGGKCEPRSILSLRRCRAKQGRRVFIRRVVTLHSKIHRGNRGLCGAERRRGMRTGGPYENLSSFTH